VVLTGTSQDQKGAGVTVVIVIFIDIVNIVVCTVLGKSGGTLPAGKSTKYSWFNTSQLCARY